MITSHMHLRAPGFPRHPRDDDLVNPFMSGFALADAVRAELISNGYAEAKLIGEDYGWTIVAQNGRTALGLVADFSSLAEPTTGVDAVVELMVSIQPQRLVQGMLWWKRDISADVQWHSELVFGFLRDAPGVEVIEEFSEIG